MFFKSGTLTIVSVSGMVPLTIEMDRDFAASKGIKPLVKYNDGCNSYQWCRPLRLALEKVFLLSFLRDILLYVR